MSGKDLRRPINLEQLEYLKNSMIEQIYRRAKYLIFALDNDLVIIMHLGMSGRILIDDSHMPDKHKHFTLYTNRMKLDFYDPRRFGLITICAKSMVPDFGMEPLTEEYSAQYMQKICANSRRNIKTLLLSGAAVVGIGNIYVCEILFAAKISPFRIANNLSQDEISALVACSKTILLQAIQNRGTSFRDYVDIDGEKGEFFSLCKVYGRKNEPCRRCASNILYTQIAGRGSFYCPICQN